MVAHQDMDVDFQPMFRGAFAQQTQIVAAVVVIQKDGASIDSALGDVERYARNFQASLAWHEQESIAGVSQCPAMRQRVASAARDDTGRCMPGSMVT